MKIGAIITGEIVDSTKMVAASIFNQIIATALIVRKNIAIFDMTST